MAANTAKDGDKGHANTDPFEPVFYDQDLANRDLPPWRNGDGGRFYLDSEVDRVD